jgi:hypothetical protein
VGGLGDILKTVAGAALGFVVGGPAGAIAGAQLVGGLTAGYNEKKAASAQADAYKEQAIHIKTVGELNARQLERRADQLDKLAGYTREAGNIEENKVRAATKKTIGAQRAAIAGGNIHVDTGTPAALQISTARQGEVDALIVRDNTRIADEAIQFEAMVTREQAEITRVEADMALSAALNQADALNKYGKNVLTSSLIKGATTVATSYYNTR